MIRARQVRSVPCWFEIQENSSRSQTRGLFCNNPSSWRKFGCFGVETASPLIAEFSPVGALEEDIIADMARLTWRKQNLATFRVAKLAKKRSAQIAHEKVPPIYLDAYHADREEEEREGYRAAEEQARQELGDIHELIDVGEPATFKGLMKELDLKSA